MGYVIRKVRTEDLNQAAEVEAACFPEAEAAGRETLAKRIAAFPDSFFVAVEEGTGDVIGLIDGCVTDEKTISDEMFGDVGLHTEKGAYQAVFGLAVAAQYRKQGIASDLMGRLIGEARANGRKGLILTCKEALIPYYERFGYQNMGVSLSVHGGAVWYDLILALESQNESKNTGRAVDMG